MRVILKLEAIADDYFYARRKKTLSVDQELRHAKRLGVNKSPSWVARITGIKDELNFDREFLRGQRDYAEANSTGSRGIFVYYALPEGIYEVNDRHHWRKVRRYYCKVVGKDIIEISKDEVIECLK